MIIPKSGFELRRTAFQRHTYGTPTAFQRHFNGIPTTFLRHSDDILTAFWRRSDGILMAFWRHSQEISGLTAYSCIIFLSLLSLFFFISIIFSILILSLFYLFSPYPRMGRTLEKYCTNLFYGRSMAKCQGTKDCSLCWVFKVGGRCTMDGKKCTYIKFHVQKTVFFRIFGPKILKKNNFSKISNLKSKWSNIKNNLWELWT